MSYHGRLYESNRSGSARTISESEHLNRIIPLENQILKLKSVNKELFNAVEHVLIASEDGGSFDDVDFNMLRTAIMRAR